MILKKLLTLALALLIYSTNFSQVYLHYGLRYANIKNNALDNLITHYNEARPWLKNKLEKHTFIPGLFSKLEMQTNINNLYIMFSASYLRKITRAKGTGPDGIDFKRAVKSRMIDIGIVGVSYAVYDDLDKWRVNLGVFPMNISWYAISSKINTNEDGWVKYSVADQFSADEGFIGTAWMTASFEATASYLVNDKFWVSLTLNTQTAYFGPNFNVEYMNIALNPATNASKLYDKRLRPHNWGFTLSFAFDN